MTALRVGVVGAGNISGAYLSTLQRLSNVEVVAVSDLAEERARDAAAAAPGARPLAVAELLAVGDVDLVLNLTIPAAHAARDAPQFVAANPPDSRPVPPADGREPTPAAVPETPAPAFTPSVF